MIGSLIESRVRFLVGAHLPDVVVDAFDEPPKRLSSLDEVTDVLGDGERGDGSGAPGQLEPADVASEPAESDVLLVHSPSYEGDLSSLADAVRAESTGDTVPIVLLVEDTATAEGLPVDGVITLPTDARTVRQITDQAVMVEAYRAAVGQFYDACKAWSGDEFDRSLLERRYEADQLFADLSPIEAGIPLSSVLRERSDREP